MEGKESIPSSVDNYSASPCIQLEVTLLYAPEFVGVSSEQMFLIQILLDQCLSLDSYKIQFSLLSILADSGP